jgi:UDP-N-acetylglucosamine--N-acetylmuramyl-(pentapeptide) pyrophosphoryl-undecaprenol N-acetylglucosamine transferase
VSNIVFTCGGTGGHVYPAIALAQYFSSHSITFLMSMNRKDRDIIQAYGYNGIEIPSSHRNPFTLLRGLIRAWYYLKKNRPNVLIATGGYHTIPVILAAKLLQIPIILLEQNVVPGRVNRYLSTLAAHTCISFSESLKPLPHATVTGNPVRLQYLSEPLLPPLLNTLLPLPTILVIGGSQGAGALNVFFNHYRESLLSKSYNLIHLTGPAFFNDHFNGQQPTFRDPKTGAVALLLPYCEDMKSLYETATIVISRAGATTIAELLLFQKKALLIPYPYARDNHQLVNAQVFSKTGNGIVIDEKLLSQDIVLSSIKQLSDSFIPPPSSQSAVECVGTIIKHYL